MWLWWLIGCDGEKAAEGEGAFGIAPVDLGSPLASDAQFDREDLAGLGAALDATLPLFGDRPTREAPYEAWALLQPSTVQDEGTCPQVIVLDDGTRYEAECRSSDGYEWSGWVEERSWDGGDGARNRLEADIEVLGDTEGAGFDSVQIEGFVEQATPGGGGVVQHLDLNLRLDVRGYFEQRAPQDPRLTGWQGWAITGSLEEREGGAWVIDTTVMSGGQATRFAGELSAGCPVELGGEADLSGGEGLLLDGASACDACGALTDGGAVCAP